MNVTVTLTLDEAQALRNHVRGGPLVAAQNKLGEAVDAALAVHENAPWIVGILRQHAEGIDLDTEEGRIDFRMRFAASFTDCRVSALRDYARDLDEYISQVRHRPSGARPGPSRAEVLSFLTNRYILAVQLGDL